MEKREIKTDSSISNQGCLFDNLPEGAFDVLLGLKQLMSRLISASGKDRYTISSEISRLTLRNLSKDVLDKLTSSDTNYRPDAVTLLAFCHVVGNLEPFSYLLSSLGCDVLTGKDKDLVELGRLQEKRLEIETKIAQIRAKRGLK